MFWSDELGYWVVSRYADCRRVLRDHETFSASNTLSPIAAAVPRSRAGAGRGRLPLHPHAHQRRPAGPHPDPAHRPPRLHPAAGGADGGVRARPGAPVRGRAAVTRARADIVAALTYELPALVVFHVLGVPPEDVDSVKEGSANRLLFMFGRAGEDEQVEIATGMAALLALLRGAGRGPAGRRRRDDFTSDLVHTARRRRPPADPAGGVDDPVRAAAGRPRDDHQHPRQRAAPAARAPGQLGGDLRRSVARSPAPSRRSLRYDSSVIHWRRRTTRPVELSGVEVPADANVLVSIGAANRDPEVFPDPDRFDIRRPNARDHLSLRRRRRTSASARRWPGSRPGSCSRSSPRRCPSLRLVPDQDLDFMPIIAFRGPRSLQVEWSAP